MSPRHWLTAAVFSWFGLIGVDPVSAAACTVNPQAVSFGSYDSLSPIPLDGVGNIHVNCDVSVSLTVTLGPGAGTYNQRHMSAGADSLDYNLFTDASRTVIWGDGIAGNSVSVTSDNVDLPVYGRVTARQNVPANSYTDSVTVTISY